MHDPILDSLSGTLLIAVPFLMMAFLTFFRLDEVIATPKSRRGRVKPSLGSESNGDVILTDPDGRPWGRLHPRR
jgi:hypothetical protein